MTHAVEFINVSKRFGAVLANQRVSFTVEPQTIHALVGENGAGKSTAMNLLFGLYPKDSGEIRIHDQPCTLRSTRDAKKYGLGMVHQHFMLCPTATVLDNLLIGDDRFLAKWPWMPKMLRPFTRQKARQDLHTLANHHGLDICLDTKINLLSVGEQQRVEILKLLYGQARILILDEPTAVLAPPEAEALFASLKKLRDQGCTVIIVTHKLQDVLRHTDAVTVFRQGRVVAQRRTQDTSKNELTNLMVGGALSEKIYATEYPTQEKIPPKKIPNETPVFAVKNTSLKKGRKTLLTEISFQVFPNEILGIAGIEGNGQSDLIRLILNPRKYFNQNTRAPLKAIGSLEIFGQDATTKSNVQINQLNIGFLPEDRLQQGFLPDMTMVENFILGQTKAFSLFGFLQWWKIFKKIHEAIKVFDIRPPDPTLLGQSFSGGNQQKLVVARELQKKSNFLIAAHPTRGVDIGAIQRIHKALLKEQKRGAGILLISSDLDELCQLATRILVLHEGHIVAEFLPTEFNQQKIGYAMCQGIKNHA